ncbi:MAG: hypothetical protein PHR77_08950 [Kiritimatiellae bacterium]|nr:hypothetical protein [Kiritimatiellia bacterium]MDD5522869.1 hypothetical protein [Kiritimatiellia bacterium]
MKQTKLILSTVVVATISVLMALISGCEKDNDTGSDLDAYFAANPYLSDPRGDYDNTGMEIDPAQATASAVGQKINFFVSGGHAPYSWGVSTPSAGSVAAQAKTQYGIYTVAAIANNSVVVSDSRGKSVIADISTGAGGLTITPAGYSFTSSFTNGETTVALAFAAAAGDTIQFTASGGNPPYSWTVSISSLGTINNGLYTFPNPTTDVGDNTIIVKDSAGDIASVTVTTAYKP